MTADLVTPADLEPIFVSDVRDDAYWYSAGADKAYCDAFRQWIRAHGVDAAVAAFQAFAATADGPAGDWSVQAATVNRMPASGGSVVYRMETSGKGRPR